MESTTINTIRQHIIKSEGRPSWPYPDIKGNVTIGTGFKIDSEADFIKLPLVDKATRKQASETEKRAAWEAIKEKADEIKKAGGHNKDADAFQRYTNVRMPEAEQDKRLNEEIMSRIGKIKGEVGDEAWNKLTDGQKAVAVDIHYVKGSLKPFPAFTDAIKRGDADACHRVLPAVGADGFLRKLGESFGFFS